MDQLGPEQAPSERVIHTLRKMEKPNWFLFAFKAGGHGALLGSHRGKLAAEKVPKQRIRHMVERGYAIEVRQSDLAQLGWVEYDITYEGVMLIRNHR